MNAIFPMLPQLFVNKVIKKWMNSHIKVVAQLSKVVKWDKQNLKMKPMYMAGEIRINFLSSVDFTKNCCLINPCLN